MENLYPITIDTKPDVTMSPAANIQLSMQALSDYHRVTAERVKLDDLKTRALRKAFITGTGILYTYWDEKIETGLYADYGMTSEIRGDIACEVLDIENVYFGNPSIDDVQKQPYIIISHRRELEDVKREARMNRLDDSAITADNQYAYAITELTGSRHTTVLTKFYKEYEKDGSYKIMAVKVTENAVIRKPWDTRLRYYPIAKLSWEERQNCIYGDSEVTHIVANQIAVNRAASASVWAVMLMGMPIMTVNGDMIEQSVTNDPGQIIKVFGNSEDVRNAIGYVAPPNFSPQFDNLINSIITNTQVQAGANDAALGNMRPDNTSAIIAVREAATMPMQLLKNRFYSFIEDNARIWADYWINLYGNRAIKTEDSDGDWFFPLDTEELKRVIVNARVDVGEATLWSQLQQQTSLDNLLTAGIIDQIQYLERLPKGTIPNQSGLINDLKDRIAQQEQMAQEMQEQEVPQEMQEQVPQEVPQEIPTQTETTLPPRIDSQFRNMPSEDKQRIAELMANSQL